MTNVHVSSTRTPVYLRLKNKPPYLINQNPCNSPYLTNQNPCIVKGPAWADTAIDTDKAHELAVCSNMGHCNEAYGTCSCNKGFEGISYCSIVEYINTEKEHLSRRVIHERTRWIWYVLTKTWVHTTGSACERMSCPNECFARGRCMSLNYYADQRDPGEGAVYR